jgi:hypothetical protein
LEENVRNVAEYGTVFGCLPTQWIIAAMMVGIKL